LARIVLSTGKRKRAIARAIIRPGKGRVWINRIPLEIYPNMLFREKVMEPLQIAGKRLWENIDIIVSVKGGGIIGQADAIRTAIARGLLEYYQAPILRKMFTDYDRNILSGDPRRTEPEKPMRYSARRRWQKSYR
jgi:small subunit ribosomal protein S9